MERSLPGLILALRGMYETLAISVPTVTDQVRHADAMMDRSDVRLARWSRRLLEVASVKLSISGREHIEPGRAYVVMSNHQSHYDIPILFQSYPNRVRMITKTELFRVPIFGPAMTAAGFIEIDRSNKQRAIESLKRAQGRLAEGVSIWIAPEGTRSRSGEVLPFKKGGFVLAMETGVDVLPVGIFGSRDVLRADGLNVKPGARVHVAFQPPIAPPPEQTGAEGRNGLMERVRASMIEAVERGRSEVEKRNAAS